jgi:hypothetical protein
MTGRDDYASRDAVLDDLETGFEFHCLGLTLRARKNGWQWFMEADDD